MSDKLFDLAEKWRVRAAEMIDDCGGFGGDESYGLHPAKVLYEAANELIDIAHKNSTGFIDISALNYDQAVRLGFTRWGTPENLMLIPEAAEHRIYPEEDVVSIFGDQCKFKDADRTVRLGFFAYGVLVTEYEEQ